MAEATLLDIIREELCAARTAQAVEAQMARDAQAQEAREAREEAREAREEAREAREEAREAREEAREARAREARRAQALQAQEARREARGAGSAVAAPEALQHSSGTAVGGPEAAPSSLAAPCSSLLFSISLVSFQHWLLFHLVPSTASAAIWVCAWATTSAVIFFILARA